MSFAAVWSGSTIFSIPKDLVRIYTVSHFQRLFRDYTISILSLIRVYTICHSQQSDQDLHYLPLFHHYHHRHIHFRALFPSTEGWAFWQVFLEGVLSTQNDFKGQQNPYLASLSFSSTLSHAWFPWPDLFCATTFSLRTSAVQPVLRSTCPNHLILLARSTTSKSWMPSFVRRESELSTSEEFYQGLHCLPFSAVWSGSTLIFILSSLIRVYTVCHFQQFDQSLHYLPFWAV